MNPISKIHLKKRADHAPIVLNGRTRGKEKTLIKNALIIKAAEIHESEMESGLRKKSLGKRISDITRIKKPVLKILKKVEKRRKSTLEIGHKKRISLSTREEIEREGALMPEINHSVNEGKGAAQ